MKGRLERRNPDRGFRVRVQQLAAALRFDDIATGSQHVCALGTSGYAYCGGANYDGQLGDGTRSDRATLVPVSGP
ncbi:MAG: hypothetical protein ACT4O1_08770 [Gemmatimonadota bacterium]